MSDDKTGGPAFPNPALADEDFMPPFDARGMTLRDYFAGQALAGMSSFKFEEYAKPDHLSEQVYRIADAMIRERNK